MDKLKAVDVLMGDLNGNYPYGSPDGWYSVEFNFRVKNGKVVDISNSAKLTPLNNQSPYFWPTLFVDMNVEQHKPQDAD